MGADLFESYAGAVIATATLAPRLAQEHIARNLSSTSLIMDDYNGILAAGVALPFWIDGFGIIASLLGTALVRNSRLDDTTTLEVLLKTIGNGVWLASGATLGFSALACGLLFRSYIAWRLFGSIAIGLVAGVIIAQFTEYCTAYEYAPTRDISAASEYGPAPVIIKGLGVGMFSVSVPTLSVGEW
jgi:K(+)-stimulated pyrophosphate-energized sodium pump